MSFKNFKSYIKYILPMDTQPFNTILLFDKSKTYNQKL